MIRGEKDCTDLSNFESKAAMMSLENSGESLTLLGLSKCKRLVVDKDKGLPLPAAEMLRSLVKPNKLFWLLPKLFVFVHWGQTEWEQYDTTRGGEPFASRWTLWHFPRHGAAHSQLTWQSVQTSHIYPLLRASVFRGCPLQWFWDKIPHFV